MRTVSAACALSLLIASAAHAQQPRDPRPVPPPTGSAVISGIVVSDERTPRPLRRARVTVNASDVQVARTTITGDDGSFVFDHLPAGRYVVAASKEGFVAMTFGARRPSRPGVRVVVADGDRQAGLTIRLPRGAVVSGTISAEDGTPLSGINVAALSYQFNASVGGRRLFPSQQPFASAVTDDRGAYRLFGLAAGEYKIAASLRPGPDTFSMGTDIRVQSEADLRKALAAVRDPARPITPDATTASTSESPRLVRLAPIYHPGTPLLPQSSTIRVETGEERNGLDFSVHRVPVATVEGFVSPVPAAGSVSILMLSENMEADLAGPRSPRGTDVSGRFVFTGVTPGTYTLVASSRADSGPAHRFGTATIIVNGEDVGGIAITMTESVTLSGRLVFEGSALPNADLTKLRVMLPAAAVSNTGVGIGPLQSPTIDADGRFSLRYVAPGPYKAMMQLPGLRSPVGRWWLKSATSRGRELLDAPLNFPESSDDIVITFAERANEVSGTVRPAAGQLPLDGYLILFSTNPAHWFLHSRRVVALKPDGNGVYRIRNVPPGDYHIVASGDVAQGEWFDPDFLKQLARRATQMKVGPEKTTADLSWIY